MTSGPDGCPACGAATQEGQDYCLECGSRLAPGPRPGGFPRSWLWASALLLLVAGGSATGAIVVGRDEGAGGRTVVATSPVKPAPPAPAPAPVATRATTTAATAPRLPTRTSPTAPPPLAEWPARDGYTVVLASLPARGNGLDDARAKATAARNVGVRGVGLLVSSRFASLHPGYYVVFAGVYASLDEAQTAANRLAGRFPNAYARQITR